MSAQNQPSHQQKSPSQRDREFFDQYSLPESKAMLWKWFTTTTTGGFAQLSTVEKENLITFYERLNALLDGIHDSLTSEDHE